MCPNANKRPLHYHHLKLLIKQRSDLKIRSHTGRGHSQKPNLRAGLAQKKTCRRSFSYDIPHPVLPYCSGSNLLLLDRLISVWHTHYPMPGTWILLIQCLHEQGTHDKHVRFLDIFSKQDWQSCSLLFSHKALFLQLCCKQTAETKWIPDFSDCICFLPLSDDNAFLPLGSYSTLMVSGNKFPDTSRVVRKLFKRFSIKHQTSWAISKCSLAKE